ncbi:MAG TPA: GNAT family N-acetyltransferase, partial [bacterium]|nr:GNAT family N-acetyltransferase [bacterium]
MDKVIIVRAVPEDAEKLTHISRQTFYETFSEQNTKENMQKYLDESFSIERLTDEMHDAHSQFYFAKSGHDIVGYIKINLRPSSAEIKNVYSLEIERIYVRRDFQGKKIGL